MEQTNQDQLRQAVKRRCMKQTEIAEELQLTNIYLNSWIKGHRNVSKETAEKIQIWLDK